MAFVNPADVIPTKSSSDGDWIAWYQSLPGPTKDKNLIFSLAWTKRGSSKANTNQLRTFLKSAGFNLGADNILGSVEDTGTNFLSGVTGFLKMGETATLVIGGLGLVFAGAIVWRLLTPQNIGQAVGVAAKVYTGGAGAAVVGGLK
jgi:hypothetical protein